VRLRYTKRAAGQIDKALDYVEERSPQGAAHVRERLLAVVTLLQLHPHAGHATSRPGVRRFGLAPYPYFIDYRVVGDDLIIMRFRHSARRPD
jgi:toxin ParE1/3/4